MQYLWHLNQITIVSGIIYDPIKNEMFYAEKDNSAFLNNHRIRVSKKIDLMIAYLLLEEKLNEPNFPYENQDVPL